MSSNIDMQLRGFLEQFAFQSTAPLPDEVTDFILGDLTAHIRLPNTTKADEDFISRFEEFINRHSECKTENTKDIPTINEKLVEQITKTQEAKIKKLELVLKSFHVLLDTKKKAQANFEMETIVNDLEINLSQAKHTLLKRKTLKSLLTETPATKEALKKLSIMTKDYNDGLNTRLCELEKSSVKYEGLKGNTDYSNLLIQWTRHQKQKNLLVGGDDDSFGSSASLLP